MKKVLLISAATIAALVIAAGGGAVYYFGLQDRGMTRDGRMAPPASVRNAPEAPRYDSSKSAPTKEASSQSPDPQLPTEFNLPTQLDISTPKVPDGLRQPADGAKT